MEYTTRSDAIANGANTYVTGKPCSNGHYAYRYVQSGSCSECINGGRAPAEGATAIARRERLLDNVQKHKSISDTLSTFREFKIVVAKPDVDLVKALILGYAKARDIHIDEKHLWLSKRPKVGVLYTVMMHQDDSVTILPMLEMLFENHKAIDAQIEIVKEKSGLNIDYSHHNEFRSSK